MRHQTAPPDSRDPGFQVGSEVWEVCRFLMNSLAVEFGPERNLACTCPLSPLLRRTDSSTDLSVTRHILSAGESAFGLRRVCEG